MNMLTPQSYYQNSSQAQQLKLALIALGVVLAAVLFIVWLVHYLTSGVVVITTSDPHSTITLTTLSGTKVASASNGKITVSLGSSQYIATVSGNAIGSSEIVKAKPHQTIYYAINPPTPAGIEPVLDATSNDAAIDPTQMLYLDGAANLSRVDANDNITVINGAITFQSLHWVSTAFGIGEDTSGNLYTITNGNIAPLSFPQGVGQWPAFTASSSSQIYISVGNDVYLGGSQGNFKLLYKTAGDVTTLIAGNNEVVALSSPDSDGSKSEEDYKPAIYTIQTNGQAKSTTLGTFNAALSPNNQLLAVGDSAGGQILGANLQPVYTIPQSGFTDPTWLDNNTLFYGVGDQLWSYNVIAQRSQMISIMPLQDTISELDVNSDKSYLYVGMMSTTGTQTLDRIGLHNQSAPNILFNLQDILPEQEEAYSLYLVSFNGTTVLVEPAPGEDAGQALQSAEGELAQDGFDLSQIHFVTGSVTN